MGCDRRQRRGPCRQAEPRVETSARRRSAALGELTHLQWIEITACSVGDAGLAGLAKIPALLHLGLDDNPAVTDATLAYLEKAVDLRELSLRRTAVTGTGLPHLKPLTHLAALWLGGTPVTDEQLPLLFDLPALQTLWLDGTNVSDAGLHASDRHPPISAVSTLPERTRAPRASPSCGRPCIRPRSCRHSGRNGSPSAAHRAAAKKHGRLGHFCPRRPDRSHKPGAVCCLPAAAGRRCDSRRDSNNTPRRGSATANRPFALRY